MKWTPEQMEAAIDAVIDNGLSISAAAKEHEVPRKTLSDKINNKHPKPPGRQTVLTKEEEEMLVNYIKYMSSHAFPLTIAMIKSFAWAVAKKSGKGNCFNLESGPGKTWWNKFRKRHHTELAIRKPGCARMANEIVVNRHFTTLGKLLSEAQSVLVKRFNLLYRSVCF